MRSELVKHGEQGARNTPVSHDFRTIARSKSPVLHKRSRPQGISRANCGPQTPRKEINHRMLTHFQQIHDLDDLREYVNQTLCQHDQLQTDAFRMTERIIRRGSKPCGIYFCLHGPRAVKYTAIWETDRNQVLFYVAGGERFQKTQLLNSLSLDRVAA